MSKITKATFKSFLKKNAGNLLINSKSSFDGMYDCVMPSGDTSFVKARPADRTWDNNLGIQGVWLVDGSGNSFRSYERDGVKGIEVYNCCGNFIVAVKA